MPYCDGYFFISNACTCLRYDEAMEYLSSLGAFWTRAPESERFKIALDLAGGAISKEEATELLLDAILRPYIDDLQKEHANG